MTTPQIRIIDGDTIIDRDMNDDELAVLKIIRDDVQTQAEAQAERASARESALAKLVALGLTDDEIAALVGA
jgi:DNA-binding NarL/FixJ family response regulator